MSDQRRKNLTAIVKVWNKFKGLFSEATKEEKCLPVARELLV